MIYLISISQYTWDDILVYSETAEDYKRYLIDMLLRLCDHQLFAKLKKCKFGKTEVEYLGHQISNGESKNRTNQSSCNYKMACTHFSQIDLVIYGHSLLL